VKHETNRLPTTPSDYLSEKPGFKELRLELDRPPRARYGDTRTGAIRSSSRLTGRSFLPTSQKIQRVVIYKPNGLHGSQDWFLFGT
jgi:hypothetical protein